MPMLVFVDTENTEEDRVHRGVFGFAVHNNKITY